MAPKCRCQIISTHFTESDAKMFLNWRLSFELLSSFLKLWFHKISKKTNSDFCNGFKYLYDVEVDEKKLNLQLIYINSTQAKKELFLDPLIRGTFQFLYLQIFPKSLTFANNFQKYSIKSNFHTKITFYFTFIEDHSNEGLDIIKLKIIWTKSIYLFVCTEENPLIELSFKPLSRTLARSSCHQCKQHQHMPTCHINVFVMQWVQHANFDGRKYIELSNVMLYSGSHIKCQMRNILIIRSVKNWFWFFSSTK